MSDFKRSQEEREADHQAKLVLAAVLIMGFLMAALFFHQVYFPEKWTTQDDFEQSVEAEAQALRSELAKQEQNTSLNSTLIDCANPPNDDKVIEYCNKVINEARGFE